MALYFPLLRTIFFSSFNQLLCEFLPWPLSLCTSTVVPLFGTLRNLLISTTIWPPTNNSKNLTSSRSAGYYSCECLCDIFWISPANAQCQPPSLATLPFPVPALLVALSSYTIATVTNPSALSDSSLCPASQMFFFLEIILNCCCA